MNRALIIVLSFGFTGLLVFLIFKLVLPLMAYGTLEPPAASRTRKDMGKGAAVGKIAGYLGPVRCKGNFLEIKIYTGGIWVKPIWMREFKVFADEIDSVREEKILFENYLRVDHHSPEVRSPLKFRLTGETRLIQKALLNLAPDYIVPREDD